MANFPQQQAPVIQQQPVIIQRQALIFQQEPRKYMNKLLKSYHHLTDSLAGCAKTILD